MLVLGIEPISSGRAAEPFQPPVLSFKHTHQKTLSKHLQRLYIDHFEIKMGKSEIVLHGM